MRPARRCPARLAVAFVVVVSVSVSGCTTTLSREELATEYYNIGSAYFELDELDRSATYLARAIELSPELARASYNLARVYVLQQRHDDALELLDALLSEDPDNVLVMETIAYAHFEMGDVVAAAQWYERALDRSPSDVDLIENLAVVALEKEDYERAAELLGQAIEIAPMRAGVYRTLAETQRELGDTESAVRAYENYLDINAEPEARELIEYSELLEDVQFYADAIAVLERVASMEESPRELQARAQFARGRLLITKAEEAQSGVDAIRAAVSLGFTDSDGIRDLLDDPLFAESSDDSPRAELEGLFRDAGLLEEEGGREDEPPADEELPAESSADSTSE